MREYGQIQCGYWTDPDIQDLSDQARVLGAYLLTGPHSNGLGCYRLPDGYLMADFGWSSETLSEAFRELFEIGFCKRCESTNYVLIYGFLRWNPITNGNVAKARQKEFEMISSKSSVFNELVGELMTHGRHFSEGFETLLKRYGKQDPTRPDPYPNQNQNQNRQDAPSDKPLDAGGDDFDDPVVETIPLNDGSEHPVTQSEFDEYVRLYPAIDVSQELRNCRGWNGANPRRRKTRSGIKSHITAWLSRAQNRGGSPRDLNQPRSVSGYTRNQAAADQATQELEQETGNG